MIDHTFRSFLLKKDIKASKDFISNSRTGVHLIQVLNDLMFFSISINNRLDASITHPVCVMNSIKNFISDRRESPSKELLMFAIDYLFQFDLRENDSLLIDQAIEKGIGLTAFLGDLEDACQEKNWSKAESLTAKTFIASDRSTGTMYGLAEIALQNFEENGIFVFHLLRAYNFQSMKEDNWAYTKCLFDHIKVHRLDNPHAAVETTPSHIRDRVIKGGKFSLYAAAERIWNSEYVRIRGFRREISHWLSIADLTEDINFNSQDSIWLNDKDQGKFIFYIEHFLLTKKIKEQTANGLVSLEAIRFLIKNANSEQIKNLSLRSI